MAVTKPLAPWYAGGSNAGVTQYSRSEAQSFCRGLLTSQTYRDKLKERVENGSIPAPLEMMLWGYAFGKPQESVDITVREDLSTLSTAQLAERAEQALQILREAKDLEDAIDAEAKIA